MVAARQRLEELRALKAQQASPARARLEELRALKSQQEAAPTIEQPTGFVEMITGSQRAANLPEFVQNMPELQSLSQPVSTGEFGKDLQIAAGMLTSFDPEARKDIIKNAVPEAEFQDFNGTTVVRFPNGQQAVINAPGLSGSDLMGAVAQALSFVPAGKVTALGKTLLQRVGIGAAASGATETGLQGISKALGSEQELDKGNIATATVLGGAAELVSPAIQAVRNAKNLRKSGEKVTQDAIIKKGLEASEATGIDLWPAQITQNSSDLERQAFVGSLPAGAERSMKAIRTQNKQAADATEELLSSIAPASTLDTGAKRFRTAAQNAIKARDTIRAEKTSPLYQQALKSNDKVNVKPVIDLIDEKITNFSPNSKTAAKLKEVKGLIDGDLSLRQLHGSKMDIDDMLTKFSDDSLGRTARREVREVQEALLNQIDEASPAYREARQEFARLSPFVTELEDSIIGRIAGLDDTQLKRTSSMIFDAAETNPSVISNARKVIKEVDPDAWNELLRVELERRLGSMSADLAQVGPENLPAQLNKAIFGNTKQRNVLFNSVDEGSEAWKNLVYLRTALNRAATGRPGGSQTATREEIKRELRGGFLQGIREWITKPIKTAGDVGQDIQFNKRVKSLSEALFNPEWQPQMSKIRKMNPDSPDTLKATMQLFNDVYDFEEKQDASLGE